MARTASISSWLIVCPMPDRYARRRLRPDRRNTSADSCTRASGMCESVSLQPRKTGVPSSDAGVVARSAGRSDEAGAETRDGRVAARMTRDELERETTALREPDERNAVGGNTLTVEIADEPRQVAPAPRSEMARSDRSASGMSADTTCGRRPAARDTRCPEGPARRRRDRMLSAVAPRPCDQNGGDARVTRRWTTVENRLTSVRVVHNQRPTSRQYSSYSGPNVRWR